MVIIDSDVTVVSSTVVGIGELDSALEHANLANMDLQKNIKNYQDRTKEKMMQLEEEQRAKDVARDVLLNAERRNKID